MISKGRNSRFAIFGTVIVALSAAPLSGNAQAAGHGDPAFTDGATLRVATYHFGAAQNALVWRGDNLPAVRRRVPVSYYGGISCVPYARENSGIELAGNAATWWGHAAGVYARGSRPELGSVLNFRSTRHMPLGHVAVVTNMLGPRVIEIDHANWATRGGVSEGIRVADVSPENDWTQVRVALGNGDWGSVYPTYGFIYDRPDTVGAALARPVGVTAPAAIPVVEDEVAELPDPSEQRLSSARHHARPHADEARRWHRHRYYERRRRYYHG